MIILYNKACQKKTRDVSVNLFSTKRSQGGVSMRKSWIVAFLVTIFLSINHSLPADFGVKQQISVDPASAGFPR